MDKELKAEFKKACESGTLYDFISNNYWKMDKDSLTDILKETIYVAEEGMSDAECAKLSSDIYQSIAENTTILEDD